MLTAGGARLEVYGRSMEHDGQSTGTDGTTADPVDELVGAFEGPAGDVDEVVTAERPALRPVTRVPCPRDW